MNHQGKKPLQVVNVPCGQLVEPLKQELQAAGFWALQSFDLRSTGALHEGCGCRSHGSQDCTCELVVLLVYGRDGGPLTLVLDGRAGQTLVFASEETGISQQGVDLGGVERAISSAALAL